MTKSLYISEKKGADFSAPFFFVWQILLGAASLEIDPEYPAQHADAHKSGVVQHLFEVEGFTEAEILKQKHGKRETQGCQPPISHPFSFAFPPEINPPMNRVIKDMAVMNQLNELSDNDVIVNKRDTSRLPANMRAKMTTKLYRIPLPTCFGSFITFLLSENGWARLFKCIPAYQEID